ncbi:MAG: WxL domain-containing protein [Solirubrobacterales bacterium]|nr:WxL domain-containing protein [Solirubrobacterales bacterium]
MAIPLTVNDTRTGASGGLGWNLTVTSTQFLSGTHTLPTTASTITAVASACANGGICTVPTNSVSFPVSVPAGAGPPSAVKFFNAAASTGIGTFTVTPTVSVLVPQNSFAGAYTSTLTISVISGP